MRTRPLKTCLIAVILFVNSLLVARSEDDPRLAELLKPIISKHEGSVAVAIRNLTTGASFSHRANEPMPSASLIKFPIMIAAYQQAAEGKVDLFTAIELKETDKVAGAGILTPHFSPGTRLSLRDAIRLMIVYSDNTATNLVIDQIGLPYTSQLMTQSHFPNTQLHSKVFLRESSIAPERSERFGLGSTTAQEMIQLLSQLDKSELVSVEASTRMYEHLLACEDKPRFGKFLPKEATIAIKTGSAERVRTAAGILEGPSGHIAICVLTSNNKDQNWGDDNAGVQLCAEIARRAFERFNLPDCPLSDPSLQPPRELAEGAAGEMVEALQRTLNKRLAAARLSVDGEFGPMTRQVVATFQQSQNLEPTGIVTTETWKALGPLILSDIDVEVDVDDFNREVLPLKAANPVVGPPFVSARAWAIGEAGTGRILWHDKGRAPKDFASTTKIMTAWLILQEAQTDPRLLEEVIVFSSEADRTPGSTCALKSGEKITVGELVFGLMLPSGNDAAVALAESIGPRFSADTDTEHAQRPISRFVSQMNRIAKELGMNQTNYTNPHGLPDPQHRSSAIDQVTLAAKVMQDPRFRNYVQTRRHAVSVEGPGGSIRQVIWKNTNELLETNGYSGVKTGTTEAAGACLVSAGIHKNDELIVVVLGSSSNQSRYIDTRNLFRWAWQQRGHTD